LNHLLPQGLQYNFILADGSRWVIAAGNEEAASIVSQLGEAMQLRLTTGVIEPPLRGVVRRLLALVDAHNPKASRQRAMLRYHLKTTALLFAFCAHLLTAMGCLSSLWSYR